MFLKKELKRIQLLLIAEAILEIERESMQEAQTELLENPQSGVDSTVSIAPSATAGRHLPRFIAKDCLFA